MTEKRIKVGLVGCGQIADAHLQQIRRIPWADPVAVCDLEPFLARQAAERFEVPGQFTSVEEMLEVSRPDVVHITTPVESHRPLAKLLLNAGVHVYVEKPFTVDADEARDVLGCARRNDRLLCLGHDQLFDPTWLECRKRIEAGEIGDVQHVESVLGYPLRGPFGTQVISNPDHWVRRLPGGLFQNTISHPLYRITEFLSDDQPELQATWFSRFKQIPFPTELRAHLRGEDVTGSLLFTSSTKPCHRLTRIYGTNGALEVDVNSQLIRADRVDRYPGAFAKIEAPWRRVCESSANLARNLRRFCKGELHYFEGMKQTFLRFYEAVLEGNEGPVCYDEILRVTEIMDRIFAECRQDEADRAQRKRQSRQTISRTEMKDHASDVQDELATDLSVGNGSQRV
jgi:predicted dehydrogenase